MGRQQTASNRTNNAMKNPLTNPAPAIQIERHILLIRGEKVMLDADLAGLYDVETKTLVQAVKRNIERFPADFMFQLNQQEFEILRSQIVTSSRAAAKHGGRRYAPYAGRAAQVNVEIMRAFVRLRRILASDKKLAQQLRDLEQKYDAHFKLVFDAIRQLMQPPDTAKKRPIGFIWNDSD